MDDCFYIDTRPGQCSLFSPPAEVEDYKHWLMTRYRQSRVLYNEIVNYYGVAQKINQIIYSLVHQQGKVFAFGTYAGAVASTIEAMAIPSALARIEKETQDLTSAQKQKLAETMVIIEVLA